MGGGFADILLGGMFPEDFTCELCGREIFDGSHLCRHCLKTVLFNDGTTCPVCGRKTGANEVCIECKAQLPLFARAISPFVYDGGVVKLIAGFKQSKPYLAAYFADLIRDKLVGFEKIDGIIFVPMTEKARKNRGYNQSLLLAEEVGRRTLTPVVDAVEKVADTPEQKGLSRGERVKNLESCFKVKDRQAVKGKSLLIVDDVLTTGATMDALTKKLLAAGAKKVFAATGASVQYKIKRD